MIDGLKAQIHGLMKMAVDKTVTASTAAVKKQIRQHGGFDKADAAVLTAVAKAGPPGKLVQHVIDGAMLAFIDKRAQRFLDAMDQFNAGVLELGGAAKQIAAKGGAR
jgi:hypothetical protein